MEKRGCRYSNQFQRKFSFLLSNTAEPAYRVIILYGGRINGFHCNSFFIDQLNFFATDHRAKGKRITLIAEIWCWKKSNDHMWSNELAENLLKAYSLTIIFFPFRNWRPKHIYPIILTEMQPKIQRLFYVYLCWETIVWMPSFRKQQNG